MKIIARIHTSFNEKFGIPRQSGIVEGTIGEIVFEPEYRNEQALRGIEGYSHLWLIWKFSEAERDEWSPTVRPPRLGGNKRIGVFATRSPFRPNPIGLSSVKLLGVNRTKDGVTLTVSGIDMLDGTPIYDIKPYLAFTDSHPDAVCGFSDEVKDYKVKVDFPEKLLKKIDESDRGAILEILAQDPRPSYKNGKDQDNEYGMSYGKYEIKFKVSSDTLTVTEVN